MHFGRCGQVADDADLGEGGAGRGGAEGAEGGGGVDAGAAEGEHLCCSWGWELVVDWVWVRVMGKNWMREWKWSVVAVEAFAFAQSELTRNLDFEPLKSREIHFVCFTRLFAFQGFLFHDCTTKYVIRALICSMYMIFSACICFCHL